MFVKAKEIGGQKNIDNIMTAQSHIILQNFIDLYMINYLEQYWDHMKETK